MASANILVVEDQRAVAGALRMRLRGLGYAVLAIAKDGNEAIEKARDLRPDLILMDIKLGDGMDGIEAAHQIRTQYDIPVVYVSAYADRALLDRARATQPAGFINKPFTTKDLLTAINLALHRQDEKLQVGGGRDTQESDAVITADRDSRITFINRRAEQLTGWTRDSLIGQPLCNVLIALYDMHATAANALIRRVLKHGAEQTVARASDGATDAAEHDHLAPLRNGRGEYFGVALRLNSSSVQASLAALRRSSNALRFVFDQLPMGVVLIDRSLQLLYINQQAERLIEAHPAVTVTHGYLRVLAEDDQLAVQALVRRAGERGRAQAPDQITSEICTLRVNDADQRLVLVATPVPADGGATVALLVFASPAYRELSAPVLRQIYGLTRAEVNLVQGLAHGFSLEQAARKIGIAVNTARTHLKHIFVKTGAKRQSELIHEVETGPAALPLKLEDLQ